MTGTNTAIIAIVGRPNVGKSTLFNRIIRRREAIVDDEPGVTRDRKYADTDWEGIPFTLVDTGGFVPGSSDTIESGVTDQVRAAIDEADLILFTVDVRTGITDVDDHVARLLRKNGKPCLLVVNKVDDAHFEPDAAEFVRLGLGEPVTVSSMGGRGIGDLLSAAVSLLKPDQGEKADSGDADSVRLAVIGRPNVGKSTFVNAILGEKRMLVTEIPGTTRDAVDVHIRHNEEDFILIDTAGMRRRSRVTDGVEYYSTLRTHRMVEECDVACVFADGGEGLTQQDMRIIVRVIDARKGVLLVVNKWDLVRRSAEERTRWHESLDMKMHGLDYVPVVFISSKTKYHIRQVLDMTSHIAMERRKRIPTPELNRFIEDINRQAQPAAVRGKRVRVLYGTQTGSAPPRFVFFASHPDLLKENYRRFLENQLRDAFGFDGVPLSMSFKSRSRK